VTCGQLDDSGELLDEDGVDGDIGGPRLAIRQGTDLAIKRRGAG
jgi:hypothetical protein